ncbi:MAG: urease accessory protein UreD [Deltaproteobacteria bacterium]|nr:urease accessory protein UreD [Deltaproteobacteria bacterium]
MTPSGHGLLSVSRVRGRSVATRARADSPLRLLLPDNRGDALWAYTTSYGGGLVDGDALSLHAHVGPDASLMLATQASTKVFRGPRGSSQRTELRLDDGALAVLLPDPVVCFAGASYSQRIDVDLAPGASLVLLDASTQAVSPAGSASTSPATPAASTCAATTASRSPTGCSSTPRTAPLDARLGGFDALATLVLLGERVAPFAAALLDRVGRTSPGAHPGRIESASPLDGGTLVRIAASTAAAALDAARSHLSFVAELIGDDPFTRRW